MRKCVFSFSLLLLLFLSSLLSLAQVVSIEKSELNTKLFNSYSKGNVYLKNGSVQEAELNYETEDNSIVFKNHGQVLTLTNVGDVDTVVIAGRKFVPVDKKFYEVLSNGGIDLLASYINKRKPVVASPDHDGTKRSAGSAANNNVAPAYVSRPFQSNSVVDIFNQFWLKRGNSLYKANNEKQLLKVYPMKHNDAIKQYISDNKIDFDKQEDLVKLVAYCNTQLK
ncbi:hypothetical protein [Paraflavitalea pollutisoli]|uniref:hypothetical protein n=1 Tax=Paraflavitalea pollutisoli TaxID=3034143 RepID=UPI0023EAA0CF|nr:hypothetical protein [Paraflavitalea sp. H1-2-19X]